MIGDVLASTVICEGLKHFFPKATVHFVANENTLAVLQGNPFIDEIVVFKNEYRNSKRLFYRFLKTFNATEYTAVLDAYGKLESNLITMFSKSKKKIGRYKWYTSLIYTNHVRQNQNIKNELPLSISNRLMLMKPLIDDDSFVTYPKIYLSEQELEKASETVSKSSVSKGRKLIMVSILGSSPPKSYPTDYMASVLDLICENRQINLLFNYQPEQKEDALAIFKMCSPMTQKCIVLDCYATSLRGFLGILAQCDLLIGNEGGAVNMAKALDIPSFCIFSPFIKKEGWHGKIHRTHVGVHLRDYHPELLATMTRKELKKKSPELYRVFKPQLFKRALLDFLRDSKV